MDGSEPTGSRLQSFRQPPIRDRFLYTAGVLCVRGDLQRGELLLTTPSRRPSSVRTIRIAPGQLTPKVAKAIYPVTETMAVKEAACAKSIVKGVQGAGEAKTTPGPSPGPVTPDFKAAWLSSTPRWQGNTRMLKVQIQVSCILGRGPTPADANPSTRGLIWIRAHTA